MSKRNVWEVTGRDGIVKVFRDAEYDVWEVKAYAAWDGLKCTGSVEEDSLQAAKDTAQFMLAELATMRQRALDAESEAVMASMGKGELVSSIQGLRDAGVHGMADKLQAHLDARKAADVELPTDADLEYYDAQAEAMGVPVREPAKVVPMVRMVRVTLFNDGTDFPGPWVVLDTGKLGHQCATLAALGMPFSVEYKDQPV